MTKINFYDVRLYLHNFFVMFANEKVKKMLIFYLFNSIQSDLICFFNLLCFAS